MDRHSRAPSNIPVGFDRSITLNFNGIPTKLTPREYIPADEQRAPPQRLIYSSASRTEHKASTHKQTSTSVSPWSVKNTDTSNIQPQATPTPPKPGFTLEKKKGKSHKFRNFKQKMLKALRINTPPKVTQVVVTGVSPPKEPFYKKWMTKKSLKSDPQAHRDSKEGKHARQEAKEDLPHQSNDSHHCSQTYESDSDIDESVRASSIDHESDTDDGAITELLSYSQAKLRAGYEDKECQQRSLELNLPDDLDESKDWIDLEHLSFETNLDSAGNSDQPVMGSTRARSMTSIERGDAFKVLEGSGISVRDFGGAFVPSILQPSILSAAPAPKSPTQFPAFPESGQVSANARLVAI